MVFYADDDVDDLEFFTDIVMNFGRKVLTFGYGEDLIHQLKNPPPTAGIIFLDINMPRRSGLDILSEIRAAERWKDLPVVMLSTSDSIENIRESKLLGANFYIQKSSEMSKLTKAIKHAISIDWKSFKPSDKEFLYA